MGKSYTIMKHIDLKGSKHYDQGVPVALGSQRVKVEKKLLLHFGECLFGSFSEFKRVCSMEDLGVKGQLIGLIQEVNFSTL